MVIEPAAVCTVPAGQALNGRHMVWLGAEVNVSAGQVVQLWLVVVLPTFETKVPRSHLAHAAQAVEPAAALNEPLAQPAQVRSAVAVPGVASNSPAAQVLQFVQVPLLSN